MTVGELRQRLAEVPKTYDSFAVVVDCGRSRGKAVTRCVDGVGLKSLPGSNDGPNLVLDGRNR